jgi:anti-sigma28 factor (negative regulator of flagellin synthesis)
MLSASKNPESVLGRKNTIRGTQMPSLAYRSCNSCVSTALSNSQRGSRHLTASITESQREVNLISAEDKPSSDLGRICRNKRIEHIKRTQAIERIWHIERSQRVGWVQRVKRIQRVEIGETNKPGEISGQWYCKTTTKPGERSGPSGRSICARSI